MEALANFTFLRPAWLLALVPIALSAWGLRRGAGAEAPYRAFVAPHLLQALLIAPQRGQRLTPGELLPWLLVAGVLALAGPSWRSVPSPFAEEKSGLMIVLHVADSMLARDLAPSRLERAQHKISDLATLRDGGILGLIAYAGSAHVVMPLTRDGSIVAQMAQALNPRVMPVTGDALGDAMRLADAQILESGQPGSILVITDQVASIPGWIGDGDSAMPVQFLAMTGSRAAAKAGGVLDAAAALSAPAELVTVDDTDVRSVVRRAENIARAAASDRSARQDGGWWLLPVLMIGALLWSRRGWSLRLA